MSDRNQDHVLAVPKFTSFKPSKPLDTAGSHRDRHGTKELDLGHGSSRSQRDPKQLKSERQHRGGSHDRRKRKRSHSRPDAPGGDSTSATFFRDTRGDPLIRKYGGIDRAQIVPYYRYGSGRILGTTGRLVMHRDGPRDYFSIRMPGEGSHFYSDNDGLRAKNPRLTAPPVLLKPGRDEHAEDLPSDFLPLSVSRKAQHDQGRRALSSSEDEEPTYRSIEYKVEPHEHFDDNMDNDSAKSDASADEDQNDPVIWKSIQLNRQLKDNPSDIDAWLELVDHQNTLLRSGRDFSNGTTESATISFANIKVGMLESALSNAKSHGDRSRILPHLMREGVKIWSTSTAIKKWQQISEAELDSFELWEIHLNFLTSDVGTFVYDDVKKMLLDRLHMLVSRATTGPAEQLYEEAIYVFLRATRLFHAAGYQELAIAAWQGLLELNLFSPQNIEQSSETLDLFRDFWESEVPRIGETGAQGWRQFSESGDDGIALEPRGGVSKEASVSRHSYASWGHSEQLHTAQARFPARTLDEGIDDDPFRVTIFSDIEPLLFSIPADLMPTMTSQLVDSFLLFCGYPPAINSSSWTKMMCKDLHVARCDVGAGIPNGTLDSNEGAGDVSPRQPLFDTEGLHVRPCPDVLFPGKTWFQYLPTSSSNEVVELAWLTQALRQLVHIARLQRLAPYYLALVVLKNPENAKKTAKALLKQYPTDVGIYNAYALAEFTNGHPDTVEKVLAPLIKTQPAFCHGYTNLLKTTWAMMALEEANTTSAFNRLCFSAGEEVRFLSAISSEVSSTAVLRARQEFGSSLQKSLVEQNLGAACDAAGCLVLLAYLTTKGGTEPTSGSQGNIEAAISTVRSISSDFGRLGNKGSWCHEQVLQFAARLLYLNASIGPFRRSYMRQQLSWFLDYFPENTMFLSLFAWADSTLRVIDETRKILDEKVLQPPHDCLSSRIFSIRHEMIRGNANTTRSAFEQALASDSSRRSPSMWVWFIRYCRSRTEFRPKAKQAFYRGLRYCPWSKALMLEAFATLADDMDSDELRAVYSTMTSKGLRIHVDLDDFLDRTSAADQRELRELGFST